MNNHKKKYLLISTAITILIIVIILSFCFIKRRQKEKISLKYFYYNSCICLDESISLEELFNYQSYSNINETRLFVALHVFNRETGNNLQLKDFRVFMESEFNDKGELSILYIPDGLQEYANWWHEYSERHKYEEYYVAIDRFYYEYRCDSINNQDIPVVIDLLDFTELEEVMRAYDSHDDVNLSVFEVEVT